MEPTTGLVCKGCNTVFSLSFVTNGSGKRPISIKVSIEWECPHCAHKNTISPVIFMCQDLGVHVQ